MTWAAIKLSLLYSLLAALLAWGLMLTPRYTAVGTQRVVNIYPQCRAWGPDLKCQEPMNKIFVGWDAGATVWQDIPAQYFFSHSASQGQSKPNWNPYIGSGYPMFLDGHFNLNSINTQYLIHNLGDKARDLLIFARIWLYIFGVVLALSLLNLSTPILIIGALTASMAHYLSLYVDIVFLDIDLLAPWVFILLLILQIEKKLTLKSLGLALILGLYAGSQGFIEALVVFSISVALIVLSSLYWMGWRSIILGLILGAGFSISLPRLLQFAHHINYFSSNRDVLKCVATQGIGWLEPLKESFMFFWRRGPSLNLIMPLGAAILILWQAWRPKESRWLLLAFAILAFIEMNGVPEAFCGLPGISGIAFYRHLTPYLNALTLILTLLSIDLILKKAERKHSRKLLAFYFIIACFPIWHDSVFNVHALKNPTHHPLPEQVKELNLNSPLGQVQQLSKTEDRRHFSAQQILYPDWSEVFEILDMRLLFALYPLNYFELNQHLFSKWLSSDGLLTRFVGPTDPQDISPELQRVMIVNRVSLLSFLKDEAKFSEVGPYTKDKCKKLGENDWIESYLCPEVGGVGYFPKLVRQTAKSEILKTLADSPLDELNGLVLVDQNIQAAQGKILSFHREADLLIYKLEVDHAGIFVIADTNFPGWEARIDGKPVEVLTANHAFKAVSVSVGKCELQLNFKARP